MKPRKTKKTKTTGHSRRHLRFHLRLASAMLICLAAAALIAVAVQTLGLRVGIFGHETYAGQNLAHSLDLRLAAKASYPSSPLRIVRKLSTPGGIDTKIVSFAVTADRLTEYALMMTPGGQPPAGGWPVIILCHGYINPSKYVTTAGNIGDMRYYAKHGFVAIKPDFRGQGMSAKQGLPTSAYYSMDYNVDIMSLISSVKQTQKLNISNINLWGISLGSYIALRASVVSPDIKNTILLSSPGGSLKDIYESYVPSSDENNIDALKIRSEIFHEYGTPSSNTPFWYNASPANFINRTDTFYQIHVGLDDAVIPPKLSADFNDLLQSRDHPHQYFTYPGGSHGLNAQRPQILARSLQLLRPEPLKNLTGAAQDQPRTL